MNGFSLRYPHLHPVLERLADADVQPGCLVAIGPAGRLVLANAADEIAGVCRAPTEGDTPLRKGARLYQLISGADDLCCACEEAEKDGESPKPRRLRDGAGLARLTADARGVEAVRSEERADFLVLPAMGGHWVLRVLARRRLL